MPLAPRSGSALAEEFSARGIDAIHARLGFRLGLGHLGEETLGVAKSGDGLQSLRWWREGRTDQIEAYCAPGREQDLNPVARKNR